MASEQGRDLPQATPTRHCCTAFTAKGARRLQLADMYWEAVDSVIPQWALVRKRVVPAGEVRRDYLASYGIALQALGSVGNALLNRSHDVEEWEPFLYRLGGVDWARTNPDWEGRILIGGRVARTFHHVALTADYLHERVGLPRSRFDVSA